MSAFRKGKLSGLLWFIGVVVVLILCSVLIHPFGPVKRAISAEPLQEGISIDARTQGIIGRSCQNCHSEKTQWPWYSYIAPVSWMIESDVSRARSHLNFSRWEGYPTERRLAFLDEISVMISARSMPPWRYLLMHREAKLSNTDIEQVSQWARAERNRLRSTATSSIGRSWSYDSSLIAWWRRNLSCGIAAR